MPKRTYHVSDISGDIIQQDNDVVTMAVLEHPLIEQPVQLYASRDEASSLDVEQDVVVLELAAGNSGERVRVIMKQAAFDDMFKTGPVDDVLSTADRYRAERSGGQRSKDWVDYTLPNTVGLIHKGLPSAKEKELVRLKLDQANENRRREGQPEIDPQDADDVRRYGLEELGVPVPTPNRPTPRPQPVVAEPA